MTRAKLFRRREIWLPTIWGWLVLLLGGTAAIVLVAPSLYPLLAPQQLVRGRLLVVEGWMKPEGLDQAIATFRAGGYEHVVTTGGRIGWPNPDAHATFAELAADYLKRRGLREVPVTAIPSPDSAQDRTFLSAVMVRDWASQSGLTMEAVDVVSSGTHARRSRLLYRLAFGPKVAVGVLATRSSEYDAGAWWRSSAGSRDVLEQAIALLWVKIFFWPPPAGTHEERWAVPPKGTARNGA